MKDYAKSQINSPKPRRKKPLITLLIIILAISIPALFFYVRYQKTVNNAEQVQTTVVPIPQKMKEKPKVKAKPQAKQQTTPKYDFYTILRKKQ